MTALRTLADHGHGARGICAGDGGTARGVEIGGPKASCAMVTLGEQKKSFFELVDPGAELQVFVVLGEDGGEGLGEFGGRVVEVGGEAGGEGALVVEGGVEGVDLPVGEVDGGGEDASRLV
ncbi:MAG: hypothetical protein Q9161_006518 [Pseudevernia consocians]